MTLLRLTSSYVEVAAMAAHSTYDTTSSLSLLCMLSFCGCLIAPLGVQEVYYACARPKLFPQKAQESHQQRHTTKY